jgi:hypothetical protein
MRRGIATERERRERARRRPRGNSSRVWRVLQCMYATTRRKEHASALSRDLVQLTADAACVACLPEAPLATTSSS